MAKRNGLWHAEAMALADRYSPATIALIVHVSERHVRRLLAANLRGGAASDQRAPREMLEAIIEPTPVYAPAAPRRAEAVAALAGGASVAATSRQLGCTRAQVDRMRDSAVLAGDLEPPNDDGAPRAKQDAERRCAAHLADLVAVYGPRSPFEYAIAPGPARFVAHGGYQGSGGSSPAAACADVG
jgi:hypothetical protein